MNNLRLPSSFRLNKIGKNPNIMSQKDDDEISNPDESAINAVVNALAAADLKDLNLKSVSPPPCPYCNRNRLIIHSNCILFRLQRG